METIRLTEDNVFEYASILGEDLVDDVGRTCYGAFIVKDGAGAPVGGAAYEIKGKEGGGPVQGVLHWVNACDEVVGKRVMEVFADEMRKAGAVRSSVVLPVKGGEVEKAVLTSAGFKLRLTEGDLILISLSELLEMPFMQKKKVIDGILPLSAITLRQFRKAISRCVMLGRKGVCEDLATLPMSWFDGGVSCCSMKDGGINGLFLVHKYPSGVMSLQLMQALDSDYKRSLPGMMRAFVVALEENYPNDTKISVNRHNSSALSLSEKLFPRGFGIPVYAGQREETVV